MWIALEPCVGYPASGCGPPTHDNLGIYQLFRRDPIAFSMNLGLALTSSLSPREGARPVLRSFSEGGRAGEGIGALRLAEPRWGGRSLSRPKRVNSFFKQNLVLLRVDACVSYRVVAPVCSRLQRGLGPVPPGNSSPPLMMPEPAAMSPAPDQDEKGIKRMHDAKTEQRFIELRVQGRSLARIAQELRVSMSTRREGLDRVDGVGVEGGVGSESCRRFPPTT
jgi:hypothetical protein